MYIYIKQIFYFIHRSTNTIAKRIGYPNRYNNHNQITSTSRCGFFSPQKLDHLVHLYPKPNPRHNKH